MTNGVPMSPTDDPRRGVGSAWIQTGLTKTPQP